MQKEIIISSSTTQNRVAITEDGNLVDFFVDHPEKRRMVGDIYLGRVARVLPGIRAAFVDIGMKHDAFLHFSDIGDKLEEMQGVLDDEDADIEEDDDDETPPHHQGQQVSAASKKTKPPSERERVIPKLHKGQDLLIQIIKEPVKIKGYALPHQSLFLEDFVCF